MKYYIITFATFVLFFTSCKENKNHESPAKLKRFKAIQENVFMLHSSYPDESVRWDRISATFNNNGGNSNSEFVINFNTENYLSKHKIDSAFVVLTPYSEETYGDNQMKISLLDGFFKPDFSWNNKPNVNEKAYSLFRKIENKEEKKIRIDITNLVKLAASEYKFNLPLKFSLVKEVYSEPTFVSFYSTNVDVKEVYPVLEVYSE